MKIRYSGVPELGEIPAHWEVTRLKFHLKGITQGWSPQCDVLPAGPDDWGVLKAGCVNGDTFNADENKRLPDRETPLPEIEVHPRDVIMSRANTTELVGSAAIAPADLRPKLLLSDKLYRLEVKADELIPEFLVYFLRTPAGRFDFERTASGASNSMQNISQEVVRNLWLPVPPINEQHAIVARLAIETAHLDALLTAKQRLLDLLAEKRKAIIATAVTRGLDPEARMTSTGVEWTPEAPVHWCPSRIGRLFRQSKILGFPDLTVLSVYREHGVIERSSRDDNANVLPDDLTKYQLVDVGDLVVNKMKAWQGSLGISDFRGITSPDYVVFRPTHSELSAYLHFMLRTPQLTTVYLSNSNGIRINQWRIEPERFLNVPVLLPPVVEQKKIVEHIARETAKLDAVRAATERTIALLKERRGALIAAAVTGQLDVRGAA